MQWLVNTSLVKVICRGIWLWKPTCPVIYRLTLNKSDLRHTSKMLNIIWKHLSSISAIRTTICVMTWPLSSALTLHRSVKRRKLNNHTEPKANKGKYEAKRYKVIATMQQTRHNRENRVWLTRRLWTENKLCKKCS